jgi:tetratricopeptide (TPR) repeat protein
MSKKQNTSGAANGGQAIKSQPTMPKSPSAKSIPAAGEEHFVARYLQFFIVTGIAVFTYLCFKNCLDNKLTNWDDLGYIINNSLIKDPSPDAIKNMFSLKYLDHTLAASYPVMGNYHPLTILLYYFEYAHYGLEPWIYHFDSVLLHVLTTITVFIFIKSLTGRMVAAAVAALLFGIHPMHVESVAWAAGRKDVLYGMLFLLSCTTYVYYIRAGGSKKWLWYAAGLVLFALSLLAKSVAVSLPVTLFLIDYFENRRLFVTSDTSGNWPGGKTQLNYGLFIEKIPHFGLSLLFGLLSLNAQKEIGAMTLDAHFNMFERFALGCYALWTYLWKAVAPTGLSNFYPYPLKIGDSLPAVYFVYPLVIIALAFVILWYARSKKAVIFGVGFFLINIVLLLQFIPVGGAIISDRYGYIPYLGLFFIAGWYVSELFEKKSQAGVGKIALGIVVGYCLVLGYMTSQRCNDWYDSVSLWRDDIEKHPEAPVAYFYLGQEYFTRYEASANPNEKKALGDSALNNFNLSVQRKPDYINPIICIAELQRNYGEIDAAKRTYYQALKINDKNESVYLGLGVVFAIKQQYDSSQYAFKKAISLKPFLPEGYSNYANFLDIVNKTDSSLAMYGVAIAQNPDAYIPYMNRGRIYLRQKKYDEAIKDFGLALEKAAITNVSPNEIYFLRAKAYEMKGNTAQAQQDRARASGKM